MMMEDLSRLQGTFELYLSPQSLPYLRWVGTLESSEPGKRKKLEILPSRSDQNSRDDIVQYALSHYH